MISHKHGKKRASGMNLTLPVIQNGMTVISAPLARQQEPLAVWQGARREQEV